MCNISPSRGVITPLITRHETCLRCRLTPRILDRSGALGWTPGSWDINCLSLTHGALTNLSSIARDKKSNVFTDRLQQLEKVRRGRRSGGGNPEQVPVKFSHRGSRSYQTGETETFPLIVKLGLTLSNNISPTQPWCVWHLIRVLRFLRIFCKIFGVDCDCLCWEFLSFPYIFNFRPLELCKQIFQSLNENYSHSRDC